MIDLLILAAAAAAGAAVLVILALTVINLVAKPYAKFIYPWVRRHDTRAKALQELHWEESRKHIEAEKRRIREERAS